MLNWPHGEDGNCLPSEKVLFFPFFHETLAQIWNFIQTGLLKMVGFDTMKMWTRLMLSSSVEFSHLKVWFGSQPHQDL